jgi:hypothetical protein
MRPAPAPPMNVLCWRSRNFARPDHEFSPGRQRLSGPWHHLLRAGPVTLGLLISGVGGSLARRSSETLVMTSVGAVAGVSVTAHVVALPADVDDDGVVDQAVNDGGGKKPIG